MERRARTRRLIEHGAILESVFPALVTCRVRGSQGVSSDTFPVCRERRSCRNRRLKMEKRGNCGDSKGVPMHRCRCCALCRGRLRSKTAMGRYTPQTLVRCTDRNTRKRLFRSMQPEKALRKEVITYRHFQLHPQNGTAQQGHLLVGAAAYRSGTKLINEWDGMTHDYTRKGGVVHSEIMLPAHAPPEFQDRSILWNSAGSRSRNPRTASLPARWRWPCQWS